MYCLKEEKMRSKLSLLNGIFGLISQIVIIVLGFVSRMFFVNCLGSELLGLNGTFTNILSILSISELGIGSAVTFCLYKPIYENNQHKIAGIIRLLKKSYSIIGIVILAGSVGVLPFLGLIIKDFTLNLNYIRLIFVLYAFNSTISYFLGYYRTLLFASQQNYIVTLVDLIAKLILYTGQIAVLILTKNYVLYLLVVTISNVLSNLMIKQICEKKFEYLKDNSVVIDDESRKEIVHAIKYLSISSIINVGVFGTDNLIISSFIGVAVTGIYSNYTLIIQNVQNLFTSLLNGVTASLGDMMAEGDQGKINRIFDVYDFAYFLVASFTTISIFSLANMFIGDIWINNYDYLLPITIVFVLSINNYMTFVRQPVWQYQNTAGIFKYFLPYSFLELVINLVVSVIASIKLGLIGVFLGTTLAYLISWAGQATVVHQRILKRNVLKYGIKQFVYFAITLIELIVVLYVQNSLIFDSEWVQFIWMGMVCLVVPNGINLMLFSKSSEFIYLSENVLKRFLRKKTG